MTQTAHARGQIRRALVEVLAGLGTTLQNVESNRLAPQPAGERFALVVRTPTDELDPESDTMGTHETRILTVNIEGQIAATLSNYEDLLDDVCLEVKARLMETTILDGKFYFIAHVSDELIFETEGERAGGLARMVYQGQYRIDALDPSTLI